MIGKLAPNRHAVGVVAEAQDRQEQEMFEASEMVTGHCYFFVVNITTLVNFVNSAFSIQHSESSV